MNDYHLAALGLLCVLALIGCITGYSIIKTAQAHEYRMAELSCTATCRNEFGHRIDCDE
jgi:hypothetical protein